MSEKNEFYELLNAYSFGCLDNDDLSKLNDYLSSGEDYPWQELGEFQNLSSLLPSILSLESPRPEVKDTVARKLYRIKAEIKAKREKQKKENPEPVIEEETEENQEITDEKTSQTPEEVATIDKENEVEEFEVVKPAHKSATIAEKTEEKKQVTENQSEPTEEPVEHKVTADDEIDTISGIENEEELRKNRKTIEEKNSRFNKYQIESEKQSKGISPVLFTIIFIILVAAILITYFMVSSNVKKYESKIDTLNNQITQLSQKFNRNRELKSVLSSKNLRTVILTGTNLAENSYGKLFINSDTQKGFIQVSGLPDLQKNKVYQLWILVEGNYLPMAKFSDTDKLNYTSFDLPPFDEHYNIKFIVTQESSGAAYKPGDEIYLTGSF